MSDLRDLWMLCWPAGPFEFIYVHHFVKILASLIMEQKKIRYLSVSKFDRGHLVLIVGGKP